MNADETIDENMLDGSIESYLDKLLDSNIPDGYIVEFIPSRQVEERILYKIIKKWEKIDDSESMQLFTDDSSRDSFASDVTNELDLTQDIYKGGRRTKRKKPRKVIKMKKTKKYRKLKK